MATSPNDIVTQAFDNATSFSGEALAQAESFIASFAENLYTAPLVDLTWTTIETPTPETVPDVPTFTTAEFSMPAAPDALTLVEPTIEISDFAEEAPTLDFGTRPDIVIGELPTVYEVGAITVPDAPELGAEVELPTMMTLGTPTFAGVDLHADYLDDLQTDTPTLELVAPTAYSYTPSAAYTSSLKTAMSAAIAARLAGGTGLNPSVEAAIWGRASDRENATGNDAIAEALEGHANLGWNLPTGALAASVRKARQAMRDRQAGLSRDVAIKQADLEQTNLNQALQQGIEWEGKLISYSLDLERIAFDSARITAENAIAVHNAGLEKFKALMSALQVRASIYDTIIKGELAKVDVYKAELQAEETKANVNRSLVEQYKAQIDARMSVIKVYEVQLQGARTLAEVEKIKVEASAERIRGFVAGVNAQTAQLEAYKVTVQAETAKLEPYKIKADVFRAVTGAQAERARMQISRLTGLAEAKSSEYRGFAAQVEAERARVMANSENGRLLLSAYEAQTRAIEAKANQGARLFEANIKQYEAQASYMINGQKINSDIIAHNRQVALDASKTGAQILAQLAGSAMGQAHASASVGASSGMSVGYSYNNSTSTAPAAVTAI